MPDRDLFGPAPAPEEFAVAELVADATLTLEEIAKKSGFSLDKIKAVMSKPQIKGYLSKHLDDAGATLEASAQVIAAAHQARTKAVVSFRGDANVIDVGPDHSTQLKAAELNLKARGEMRGDGQSVNLFMGLKDEELARIANGELDPATLIDVGPRVRNPADVAEGPK